MVREKPHIERFLPVLRYILLIFDLFICYFQFQSMGMQLSNLTRSQAAQPHFSITSTGTLNSVMKFQSLDIAAKIIILIYVLLKHAS